jgi:alpha-mannosidase
VRARLAVVGTYELPTHVVDGQRAGAREVEVTTTLELRAGEDLLRVEVAFDNHGLRDHRLRVHLPLPHRATTSRAECAFAVVERGLEAEGGPTEAGLPTFPSRRFVTAGGLTVAHEGLLEYELVDVARPADGDPVASALALTLLRCTGMLSQGPMATRPLPAGPLTPMEGPQSQGPAVARFALHLGGRNPYAVADDAFVPLLVTRGGGGGGGGESGGGEGGRRAEVGQLLAVDGAEVSAITREAGVLHVRVFNPTDQPTTVRIADHRGWLLDLRGRPLAPFEGRFELAPWQIATAALA